MKYFYLGANIHQEAIDIISNASNSLIIYEKNNALHVLETLESMERDGRAFSIDKPKIVASCRLLDGPFIEDRERILHAVLNDFKVFLLRMRYLRADLTGAFNGLAYFSDVIDYAIKLVGENRPNVVFCSYTPHTVESWIVVRTFEELGARVIRLIDSPMPWVLLPVQGLSNKAGVNLSSVPRAVRSYAIDEYLDKLSSDYSIAIPYYEKLATQGLGLVRRLMDSLKRLAPREVMYQLEKRAVWKEFQLAAEPLPDRVVFGVYFLHYQPEMNTLPEAGIYCDQFQAVSKLANALPPGVILVVKEHPSTFAKRCDRRWRPRGFYARFLELPNVKICPAKTGAFELIDRSLFVASIAGVCMTEALARSKPVVTFFTPRFADFFGEVVIDANQATINQLRHSLSLIAYGKLTVSRDKLRKSIESLIACGYDGALDNTYLPNSVDESYGNSMRANRLALKDVIAGSL